MSVKVEVLVEKYTPCITVIQQISSLYRNYLNISVGVRCPHKNNGCIGPFELIRV